MSFAEKIKEDIKSTATAFANRVFIKLFASIIFGCVGLIAIAMNKIFGISSGISIMIVTISTLCIYIVYKIVRFSTTKRERIENQTLWDKLGISEEMRLTLADIVQKAFIVIFIVVLFAVSMAFVSFATPLIITAIFVIVLISYKYGLHIKLYNFIILKIKVRKETKYAYTFKESDNTVCNNCAALISKSDSVCFNCGAVQKKSKAFVLFLLFVIVIFAIIVCVF
jgi:hypothetical protein